MKKFLTFLIVMFLFNINAKAASSCTYEEQTELNSKAANVKISYEIIEEKTEEEEIIHINRYFKVSIVNVTEDFYIVIKNSVNDEEKTFTKDDAQNGIITFNWTDTSEVTNFTAVVYTTNNTNCANEKYKTLYFTTPRYNEYSDRAICSELPDFYLCQEFVTFSEIDNMEFANKLDNYINEENDNEKEDPTEPVETPITDKIFNFINKYKWFIIGGVLVITAISITVHRIKTKKQRELGL